MDESIEHELNTLRKIIAQQHSEIWSSKSVAPTNIPIPDPSAVTVKVITETKHELREEFKSSLEAQGKLLVSGGVARHEKAILRIEGVEKAQALFEDNLNRVPTQLDREASRLTDFFNEKLRTVDVQIDSFKDYAAALREASEKSIKAAFEAAEKQGAKSEASYTKEIDSLKALLNASDAATSAAISNLTGRLDRGEAGNQGSRQTVDDKRASLASTISIISAAVSCVAVVIMVLSMFHTSNPTAGADTKRVDDLVSSINEQSRAAAARMDSLSARLNSLTPTPTPVSPITPSIK